MAYHVFLLSLTVAARELTFFVKQQPSKIQRLEEIFHAVSDPDHKDYGKHLTHKEVIEYQRPTPTDLLAVKTHIAQFSGVGSVRESLAGDKVVVSLIDGAGGLLLLPSAVLGAVDFVADTAPVQTSILDPTPNRTRTTPTAREITPTAAVTDPTPSAYACLKKQVNPTCLRKAYGINDTKSTQPHNSQAVIVNQEYKPADLAAFFKAYDLPAMTTPIKNVGKNGHTF